LCSGNMGQTHKHKHKHKQKHIFSHSSIHDQIHPFQTHKQQKAYEDVCVTHFLSALRSTYIAHYTSRLYIFTKIFQRYPSKTNILTNSCDNCPDIYLNTRVEYKVVATLL
jgi:hypothetical protein